jgi:hypothetical protein
MPLRRIDRPAEGAMLLQQFEGERGGLRLGISKVAAKDFVVVRSCGVVGHWRISFVG